MDWRASADKPARLVLCGYDSLWHGKTAARQGVEFLDCAPLHFELNELDGLHYSKGDHQKLALAARQMVQSMLG